MGAQCIAPLPDVGFRVLKLDSSNMEIAKMKPDYFIMRDASAVNDNVLDNFEQIFKHYSTDTIRKIL